MNINKLTNNTFSVNTNIYPSLYAAYSNNNYIILKHIYTDNVIVNSEYDELTINGTVPTSINDAISELNSFIMHSESQSSQPSQTIPTLSEVTAKGSNTDKAITIGSPTSDEHAARKKDITDALISFKIDLLQLIFPIGAIFTTNNDISPDTYLNFGTWEKTFIGRVPVGVDSTKTEFNVVGKKGGHMDHDHTYGVAINSHYSAPSVENQTDNSSGVYDYSTNTWAGWTNNGQVPSSSGSNMNGSFVQSVKGTVPVRFKSEGATKQKTSLQPYETCYFWKRIN